VPRQARESLLGAEATLLGERSGTIYGLLPYFQPCFAIIRRHRPWTSIT
jgi:hypothetical protein